MPFSLETETQVTVSMGLETTAGVGAAYNTRLYIDQVKLYSKDEIIKTYRESSVKRIQKMSMCTTCKA